MQDILMLLKMKSNCEPNYEFMRNNSHDWQWASCYDSFPTLRLVQRCMGYSCSSSETAALEAPRILNLNNNKYFSGPYGMGGCCLHCQ
ncbi:unnamed protein product [Camellia sinensis]